ncbi:alpha-mannosidase [Cohnella silvisoli]|uniref:Glycoside hydrolase family 38 C-terminal domain-containing protein n=1 Tax=Cohnella silvisoli TaxID=2873699 RepID=A0ABV1L0C8_9BACL|nr:glycoside hydrolase family 38 C-terminal domain-containing protein [Cohnella silvisoli]MCD9025103.1 alpha-mannosidase [Cohnella silvisoli]
MTEKKTVHIISHSHWDREWYLPFEKFRIRLVELMDKVIGLLESNESDFHYFHLDGHVLLVEDYLEIRPEMAERIKLLIRAKKLFIGPWYVLQDAFLTSGEAQLRNLQLGIERAEQLGGSTGVGYFPDTFGNISQSAQILKGFEIDTAVFGRGINAIAENNTVQNDGNEGYRSELWWEGPDGSKILSVFLANWYHNGMELPVDSEAAKVRAAVTLGNVERFAGTDQLLLLNGCDHQPVQTDVGPAIQALNDNVPGYRFIHSNFPDYLNAIAPYAAGFQTVYGELTSQETDGWATLVNTASSRLYLKQWNAKVQNELERWAEPFSAIAWKLGEAYPEAFMDHAWKLLLQNHPHDSICGCSLDEVHEEMVVRFKKAHQIAAALSEKSLASIAGHIDTASLSTERENAIAIVVFNPLGWMRDDWVEAQLDVPDEMDFNHWVLLDPEGNQMPYHVEDLGWTHGFTLPDDRFRIPWVKRRYLLKIQAQRIPAVGYATFMLTKVDEAQAERLDSSFEPDSIGEPAAADKEEMSLENEYISVAAASDGSLSLLEKHTGKRYEELLVFEDAGDIGNEYMYKEPEDKQRITTKGTKARISRISPTEMLIIHEMDIPLQRNGQSRSQERIGLKLEVLLTLRPGARRVEVVVKGNNAAKDHRLRALFPTDLTTDICCADAPFDVVRRKIQPWSGWENPNRADRMQTFVDVSDERQGLMVAARGLPEYEVLRDGRNTVALTLLRCVGELGDWNVFATPEAQCLGTFSAEFAIVPHEGDYVQGIREAHAFQTPLRAVTTSVHKGSFPCKQSWVSVDHPALWVTSLKKTRAGDDLSLRFVNLTSESVAVSITGESMDGRLSVGEALLNEKCIGQHAVENNALPLTVPAKKIISLLI